VNPLDLRSAPGLTVEQMARALKIQPETLLKYEAGCFCHIPEIRAEIDRRLQSLRFKHCRDLVTE